MQEKHSAMVLVRIEMHSNCRYAFQSHCSICRETSALGAAGMTRVVKGLYEHKDWSALSVNRVKKPEIV